ncbi:GtrA family protein [Candidatus Pacearchaeota archaeon]|nr:GtrA family protein [Candidatus Pacearchaeota archaeon]
MNKYKKLRDKKKFLSYSTIGFFAFLIDISILYFLVERFSYHYITATVASFIIAVSFNYTLNRSFTYKGTKTSFSKGYIYFMSFAVLGAIIVSFAMYLFVEILSIHYLTSRTIIAVVIGILNYTLNTKLTFDF